MSVNLTRPNVTSVIVCNAFICDLAKCNQPYMKLGGLQRESDTLLHLTI